MMKYTQTFKKSHQYADGNKKTKKQYASDFQKKLRRFASKINKEYTKRPVKVSTQYEQVEIPVYTVIKVRNNFDLYFTSFIEIEVKDVPSMFKNMKENTVILISKNIYMFFGKKEHKANFKSFISIDL